MTWSGSISSWRLSVTSSGREDWMDCKRFIQYVTAAAGEPVREAAAAPAW